MESQKKSNRTYLTPEQVVENNRKSRYNWYLNHKDYYKPGGHGYDCIMRKTLCDCGQEVTVAKLSRHQRSKLHAKRMSTLTQSC